MTEILRLQDPALFAHIVNLCGVIAVQISTIARAFSSIIWIAEADGKQPQLLRRRRAGNVDGRLDRVLVSTGKKR